MPDLYTIEIASVCEKTLPAALEDLLLELAQTEPPCFDADDIAPP